MNLRYVLLLALWLGIMPSCMSAPKQLSNTTVLHLSVVEQISLGSHQSIIEQRFGKPTETKDVFDSKDSMALVYSDDSKTDRATFIIDKKTGQLLAKAWQVEDGDSEQNVEVALKRYPKANFKKRDSKWIADFSPDEAWYEDRKLGITIRVRKKRNEVSSIIWSVSSK